MKNPLDFFADLFQQPRWIPIWVSTLMVVNLVSVTFWVEPVAKAILAIFIISALGMMALYAQFGFTKILGLGHSLWVPLLIVVLLAIPNASGLFQGYLILWSGLTTVSLAFDIIDVWTYFTS
ncbi:hypothetical protein [Nodosilinea sp. P-1105]|uniref:hypothetical protein n=1 Tax=Nodosilinea sp. P-1105 TaxID=2546229 RepID=UPI00146D65B7|nr:hypothetical protein [Nodosilinea sp. P-1105]NMF84807.1 hypothetical protein [Nodosilinea sp. P-1105]